MKIRPVALALSLLVVAACGDDDDTSAAATITTAAPTTTTSTTEPSTTTAATAEGIEGADAEAAAAAVAAVFDSSVPFDEKVALLEGGEAHRAGHDAYLGAAEGVGGITVQPVAVTVDGDTATVVYNVSFAGSQVYDGVELGLDMTAIRMGDTWVVPTSSFCDFLASARTPCSA